MAEGNDLPDRRARRRRRCSSWSPPAVRSAGRSGMTRCGSLPERAARGSVRLTRIPVTAAALPWPPLPSFPGEWTDARHREGRLRRARRRRAGGWQQGLTPQGRRSGAGPGHTRVLPGEHPHAAALLRDCAQPARPRRRLLAGPPARGGQPRAGDPGGRGSARRRARAAPGGGRIPRLGGVAATGVGRVARQPTQGARARHGRRRGRRQAAAGDRGLNRKSEAWETR